MFALLTPAIRACARQLAASLFGLMMSSMALAAMPITAEERAWLTRQEGTLEVLFGYQAPPNAFHDEDGRYTGYLVDVFEEIERELGTRFRYRNFDTWQGLMAHARTGRNFIIVGIAPSQERASYLSFTAPFVKVPYVIVTRHDADIEHMSDLGTRAVCTVGNYAVNDYLAKEYARIKPQPVTDNLEGLRAVSTGACDAMIINQMYATYLIDREGITNLRIAGESGYLNRLSVATAIDDAKLFSIVDKAVDAIGPDHRLHLYRKWVSPDRSYLQENVFTALKLGLPLLLGALLLAWAWGASLRLQVRRQTQALARSTERFERAVKNAPIPMILTTVDKDILLLNDKATELFGYTLADTPNLSAWFEATYPDPDERAAAQATWRKAIADGRAGDTINVQRRKIVAKDGSDHWVDYHMTLEGEVSVVTVYDVTEQKHAEDALRQREAHFRALFEALPDLVWLKDPDGVYLACNRKFERLLGASEARIVGHTDHQLIDPARADISRAYDLAAVTAGGPTMNEETGVYADDGHTEYLETIKTPVFDDQGALIGVLGVGRDITARKLAENRLRLSASVFESTAEGVIITDAGATIVDVNRAFTEITGFSAEDVIGKNPRLWQSGRHDTGFYADMWRVLLGEGQWRGEMWNRRKDGHIFPSWQTISRVLDDAGNTTHYVSVLSDISKIKDTQQRLKHIAHHDPLTNLPNRLLLDERLRQFIVRANRHHGQFAVIFLDLDLFKHINDSLGHPVGDALLRAVAERLLQTVRHEDTVARVGGDEFIVVLDDLDKGRATAHVVRKVAKAFQTPFLCNGREIGISASLGICVYPADGKTPAELMRNADAAMYRAKASGRDAFHFYTEKLTHEAVARMDLESRLRKAIDNEALSLHYQAQVELGSGRIIGVEALIRWQDPDEGLIGPNRFIPLAEETGLIHRIGPWVLRTACQQGVAWLAAGHDFGRIAVNVSGRQFQRGELVNEVRQILEETGLPADRLELEITESFIMSGAEQAIDQLTALRALGIFLAIDDFGTGYSSLSYLKRLPVQKLKIDQSFIRDIPEDPDDMAIAAAVIALGQRLGLTVIAEGVETEAQAAFLRAEGCLEAQGYLYARPDRAAEVEARFGGQQAP